MVKKRPLDSLKEFIGEIPLTAELYWRLRQADSPPPGSFSLEKLKTHLPVWREEAAQAQQDAESGKHVLLFATFGYWVSQTAITGLALAGLGHRVSLGFLPYTKRQESENKFDLRRQNTYIKKTLALAGSSLNIFPFWDKKSRQTLPPELKKTIEGSALRDIKYILLREDVDSESDLYYLRVKRNIAFAKVILAWLQENTPDAIVIPNGSILEFGVLFYVGRYLDIPVITYEFGEQRERMWLAPNRDVMRQKTDTMWEAFEDQPLTEAEWEKIRTLFSARQGADLWQNFSRQWQKTASQGGEEVRATLGLDQRPVVFLPTNVLGDSLTLGRQIFSEGMTELITRTIQYFIDHPQYQLVIRIHPGEQLGWGPSVYEILKGYFENLPENIHIIPADAAINSYDLIEIASFATVFTTTLGMEMAMSGVRVIVAGETHYRGKGFTADPDTWEGYFEFLEKFLKEPAKNKLSQEQVEQAWTYAYRFFFDYPFPFPWHVQHLWESVEKWPLKRVLSEEGLQKFGDTFRYLVGEPIDWKENRNE
ncbi:MAG: hypothetical protein MAG431_01992 [Chloroflexi bacterium]|nr:hypothetical protein [Chloroflexota bacterium]